MAFRASNALPQAAYRDARTVALHIRDFASARATSWAASGCTANDLFALCDVFQGRYATLQELAAVPGIAAYAQAQEADPGYDVAAEFTTMLAALAATVTTVVALFPADGANWLLSHRFNADGSRTPRAFTPAQLAPVISNLQAVSASIV